MTIRLFALLAAVVFASNVCFAQPFNELLAPTYARPGHFRTGIRDTVWKNALEPETNRVRDSVTGRFISRSASWHMGHRPGYEFAKHRAYAVHRGILRNVFLDEHNNPMHYRPELPHSNMSHRGESPKHINFYLQTSNQTVSKSAVKPLLQKIRPKTFIAVDAGIEGFLFVNDTYRYRKGSIGQREYAVRSITRGGGFAGMTGGAAGGAYIGVFGGPVAWITVPVGTVVGGTVGYAAGRWAFKYAANVWYDSLDKKMTDKLNAWIVNEHKLLPDSLTPPNQNEQ
jgi:hypothetical protein